MKQVKQSALSVQLDNYQIIEKNESFKIQIAHNKSRYDIFQYVNNNGIDQTARMRRLVSTFVVRKPARQVFWRRGQFDNCKIGLKCIESVYEN